MIREFDGIEYASERSKVQAFRVGDRIGNAGMLITKSESDPSDIDCWLLTWVQEDGTTHDYEGAKDASDMRWRETTYVIQESP